MCALPDELKKAKQSSFTKNKLEETNMEAIEHTFTKNCNTDGHFAADCPQRVVSVVVGGKRHFLEHTHIYDGRGSHMGQTQDEITLIQDPERCCNLRSCFVKRCDLDARIVRMVIKSPTKSIIRGGSDGENGPWHVHLPHMFGDPLE